MHIRNHQHGCSLRKKEREREKKSSSNFLNHFFCHLLLNFSFYDRAHTSNKFNSSPQGMNHIHGRVNTLNNYV